MNQIPLKNLVEGYALTVLLFVYLGQFGFTIIGYFMKDREKINKVRELYLLCMYIMAVIIITGVLFI